MDVQLNLRQAAEQDTLTYLIALGYEQKPRQLLQERGLTFAPMPPAVIDDKDPAKFSNCTNIDFNNDDISPLNANFLAATAG